MGLLPKLLGNLKRSKIELLPPGHFIAGLVQLPMMAAAERDCGLQGRRPQIRQGWDATNFRCALRAINVQSCFILPSTP